MTHEPIFANLESEVRAYCRETPNLFATARGAEVWDVAGRRFIDFLSGCGSLNYGHNHPDLKRSIIEYLEKDGVGNALDFHTEAKLRFLTRFDEVILKPKGLSYVMQFTGPTGANCVEAALKVARKYTRRQSVVSFTNAFHGMSAGALAVTGSSSARAASGASLNSVVRLPYDGYRGAGLAELDRFLAMADDPSGGIDPPAAMIVETVQGEGGLNVASVQWLRKLRDVCTSLGALMIVDDIQAGCGRTGDFLSFERAGIVPDLVCLSKSLSGIGLPMSMLLVTRKFDVWYPGEHNGTFRGNGLAFVAAARAIEFWSEAEFESGVAARSAVLEAWAQEAVAAFPRVLVRKKGLGMMLGLEFLSAGDAGAAADEARRTGMLIERCGPHGEVLKLLAPINIDHNLLAEGLQRLTSAIALVAERGAPRPRSRVA